MIKEKIRIRAVVDRYYLTVLGEHNRLQRSLALKECIIMNSKTSFKYSNVFCSCDVNKALFSLHLNHNDVIEFNATYVLNKKPKLIELKNIKLISKSKTLKKEYSINSYDETIHITENSPEYEDYRNPYLNNYLYDLSGKPLDDDVFFLGHKYEFFGNEIIDSECFIGEMLYIEKSKFYSDSE